MTSPLVTLRPVTDEDVEAFYRFQADPVSNAMAAFPARDPAAHQAHWARIRQDDSLVQRTILCDGVVAGNIGVFPVHGVLMVGYWVDRAYWGQGVATSALRTMLVQITARPIEAHVVEDNLGSRRVLEKCGFELVGIVQEDGDPVREAVMRLDAVPAADRDDDGSDRGAVKPAEPSR